MIRFDDLTEAYWTDPSFGTPICALLSTSDNRFITCPGSGEQTFSEMYEIEECK